MSKASSKAGSKDNNYSIMSAEFFEAVEAIEKEKGIPREYMFDKIRQALTTAFKRDNPECEDNVFVDIDEDARTVVMTVQKTVVEDAELEDPSHQMTLDEAKRFSRKIQPQGEQLHVLQPGLQFSASPVLLQKQVIAVIRNLYDHDTVSVFTIGFKMVHGDLEHEFLPLQLFQFMLQKLILPVNAFQKPVNDAVRIGITDCLERNVHAAQFPNMEQRLEIFC